MRNTYERISNNGWYVINISPQHGQMTPRSDKIYRAEECSLSLSLFSARSTSSSYHGTYEYKKKLLLLCSNCYVRIRKKFEF